MDIYKEKKETFLDSLGSLWKNMASKKVINLPFEILKSKRKLMLIEFYYINLWSRLIVGSEFFKCYRYICLLYNQNRRKPHAHLIRCGVWFVLFTLLWMYLIADICFYYKFICFCVPYLGLWPSVITLLLRGKWEKSVLPQIPICCSFQECTVDIK